MLLVVLTLVPFATSAQWCTPSPSSKDDNGITNVTFGVGTETVNDNISWSSSPFYMDHRTQIGAVPAGTACEMGITFATGYTYGTIIWVDWDQDSTFEGTEVVWVGTAPSTNPTTVNVSFDIPSSQDTGTYFLRICAADSYFDSYAGSISAAASANPCASYSWGVGLDYTLRVTEAPSCIRPESLVATNVTSSGLTLGWTDIMNTGATYSIDYWKNGGDTNTVTSTTTSYTFTGLDANSLYNFAVKAVCSATDESLPLSGSFATLCGGSTCDMTFQVSGYSFSYYGASVEFLQNGVSLGTYTSNNTVEVCSTDTVAVKYHPGSYSNTSATVTVYDGGGVQIFSGNGTNNESILTNIATPCPSCIPPMDLVAVADSNEIEFSWTPRSGATLFAVYMGDSLVSDNVTNTFYTFTGLTANTQYTLGVQAICTAGDTSSLASASVRTECGSMQVPFYEDFSTYTYGTFPECWHRVLAHGSDPSVNTEISGLNGSMYMFLLASGDSNLFVTPSAVPLAGDQISVSYDAYLSNSGMWIKAGVMTNYNDISTFIALDSVGYHNFNNNFESYDFNTSSLDPTAILDIVVAHQSEGEVESWCHHTARALPLSQHVAHVGQEPWQQYGVL